MRASSQVDLNADIGEGMPYDKELIKYISSCNIACGGHVGDIKSIEDTIQLAKLHGVKVGAHPSYADPNNFGRKSIDISTDELVKSIDKQLQNFKNVCDENNVGWHHIKFHGALYNDLKWDKLKAVALIDLLKEKYSDLVLYVPPHSVVQSLASKRIAIKIEGFADRAYHNDFSLVSRQKEGAVFNTNQQVISQVHEMIINQRVKTIEGEFRPLKVQTLCIHGDTLEALDMARAIVRHFEKHNVIIQ